MSRLDVVLKKLIEVDDNEWFVAMNRCKKVIDLRTKGRTLFGAHSEKRLEMEPFDYYFNGAVDKLYEGNWDWKFEKYSLAEQLVRIVGSMISEEVRKYKQEHKKEGKAAVNFVPLDDIAFYIGVDFGEELESQEREKIYAKQLSIIERAIGGNEDMEYLFILISEGKNRNQICEETGWDKKKLYKLTERMNTKIKNYIAQPSPKA